MLETCLKLTGWPRPDVGMTAIEVKDGQTSINDGQWYQSDRGQDRKIQRSAAI